MKSIYFANNQPLWIKFSFDSHKIKDWFSSVGRQQKQPSRSVLRKCSSEDMQQICTSNHMFKREIWDKFNKFTLLKFWNLSSEMREISNFQKMNKVNFSQISPETSKYWVGVQRGQSYLKGASLALVGHPSSDGVTIKMPYGVDILHWPALNPIFEYGVGLNWIWLYC